jgi:predicted membrane-bound dolichyl-phosphate-mannose-protein mannosyltransferase
MFSTLNTPEILKIIVISLFSLGTISLASGIFILFKKVMGDELKIITSQTAKLVQKGLAEEVAGLVGNASALLEALNQLIRTTTGVGVFMMLVGFILMVVAYFLALQI